MGLAVGAYYGGPVKEMLLQLKFHRLRAAEEAAATLVAGALPEWPVEVVTSVPVSAGRYRERGFNQAELIARKVAGQLGLPYSPMLLRRSSVHQLGQDRRTRLEQVRQEFPAIASLDRQNVLIVDDVVTTGATLSECANVLLAAGAAGVWGAAVARH